MRPPRIALYGHDTLGLGHLRRNLALAASLSGLDPKPDILIDAVAVLRDRGLRVPLRLAGGGRLEVALRDQVTGCDLGDLITFLGPLPQHVIHDLVAGATMFAAGVLDRLALDEAAVTAYRLATRARLVAVHAFRPDGARLVPGLLAVDSRTSIGTG